MGKWVLIILYLMLLGAKLMGWITVSWTLILIPVFFLVVFCFCVVVVIFALLMVLNKLTNDEYRPKRK